MMSFLMGTVTEDLVRIVHHRDLLQKKSSNVPPRDPSRMADPAEGIPRSSYLT